MNNSDNVRKPALIPYPWQETQWRRVERLIYADKLPHAMLFSGVDETGKLDFALALAARLLCLEPRGGHACGDCKGCKLFEAGSHPDLLMIEPAAKGKAISVDTIRELITFAAKTAMLNGWRIVIVNPAEAMTQSAANALLKILEEPGGETLIMMVHHQKGELLATIRSRCQTMLFPVPSRTQVDSWLQGNAGGEQIDRLLELAAGRPLAALRIAQTGMGEELQLLEQVMDSIVCNRTSPVQAAEALKALTPLDFVEYLLAWQLRDIRGKVEAGKPPERSLFQFLDQLLAAKRLAMSKANPNPQLFMEELLMGWQHARSIVSA